MNVNELRTNRAKAWEAAKNFLDSHRNENGMLSLEDTKTYEEMEAKIVNLGKEIERQERMDAMEREMAMPVNTPITTKPENTKMDDKKGRASDARPFFSSALVFSGFVVMGVFTGMAISLSIASIFS